MPAFEKSHAPLQLAAGNSRTLVSRHEFPWPLACKTRPSALDAIDSSRVDSGYLIRFEVILSRICILHHRCVTQCRVGHSEPRRPRDAALCRVSGETMRWEIACARELSNGKLIILLRFYRLLCYLAFVSLELIWISSRGKDAIFAKEKTF